MNVWIRDVIMGLLLLLMVNGLYCMYKLEHEEAYALREYIFLKQRDAFGCLPIYYAVLKNDFELVKKMVERGSPLNETSRFFPSLLSLALENGNIELYNYLVAHGATNRGMPLPELSDSSDDDE
jgi:ankyrin repeat protein